MRMTEEQRNEFINKNMGLIGLAAHKPFATGGSYTTLAESYGYHYVDVVNTGVIGMIEGIEEYDINKATTPEGVVPLEAFVNSYIKKHLSKTFAKHRKGDRLQNKVAMDQKIFHNDGSNTTIGDMMAEEKHEEKWGDKIDIEVLNNLLASDLLTDSEVIAIDARFMKGYKLWEINEVLQVFLDNPKAKAFYFIETALKKLQKALVSA